MQRVVLCMKWGTLFGPDYVNVLYSACQAHISGPFRFVCLTDDATGLSSGVETFPIPDIGCSTEMWFNGAWPKLAVFAKDLYGLTGRALFIDMDTVVTGNLDRFFDHDAPLIGIDTGKNWHRGGVPGPAGKHPPLLGTGVFAFTLGAESQILERFQTDPAAAFAADKIEQVWVQAHAHSVAYWPAEWVISFKRWLRRPIGLDLLRAPKAPPPEAGVVAFHGDPRPITLIRKGLRRWDSLPHLGYGQVGWMAEYWQKHGGTIPE